MGCAVIILVGLVVAGDFRLAGWVARVYIAALRGSICVSASPVDICAVSVVGTVDINQQGMCESGCVLTCLEPLCKVWFPFPRYFR
jgi:hypothetical protein